MALRAKRGLVQCPGRGYSPWSALAAGTKSKNLRCLLQAAGLWPVKLPAILSKLPAFDLTAGAQVQVVGANGVSLIHSQAETRRQERQAAAGGGARIGAAADRIQ